MSQDQDYDPFADFSDLDEFDNQGDGEGFDELGAMDMSSDDSSAIGDEHGGNDFDDNAEYDSPAEPAAPTSGKAGSSSDSSAGMPKPFFKTPIGMVSIGLGVLAAAGITVGVSGMLSSGEPEYVATFQEQAPVQPMAEPSYAGLPQASGNPSPLQAQMNDINSAPAAYTPEPMQEPVQALPVAQLSFDPKELFDEIKTQRKDLRELKTSLDALSRDVRTLGKSIGDISKENESIRATLADIGEKLSQVDAAPVAVNKTDSTATPGSESADGNVADAEAVKAHPAVAGRDRIADFSVIDVSSSGDMVIIKKDSNGRVFTVFKGEILNISGKRHPVTAIEDSGSIILVGKSLFIDRVLEKPVARPAPRPAPRPVAAKPAEPVIAEGISLNAVYDQNRSFGVMVKGEYHTWSVGQSIPQLNGAKVTGLDKNGNLKVGNHIIKSVY